MGSYWNTVATIHISSLSEPKWWKKIELIATSCIALVIEISAVLLASKIKKSLANPLADSSDDDAGDGPFFANLVDDLQAGVSWIKNSPLWQNTCCKFMLHIFNCQTPTPLNWSIKVTTSLRAIRRARAHYQEPDKHSVPQCIVMALGWNSGEDCRWRTG